MISLKREKVKLREILYNCIIIVQKAKGEKKMDNMKILLCCGAGMSSGFLASNARKVAKKKKLSVSVEARSHTEVADYLNSIDVLLLGPHYATELEKYQALADSHHVPVAVIPQDIYSTLDGARLLEMAEKTIADYQK